MACAIRWINGCDCTALNSKAAAISGFFIDTGSYGPAALAKAIVPSMLPLLDIAPANPFYEHSAHNSNPRLLADALAYQQFSSGYQMIVIDTAPSLDILLVNALCAATGVLIPFLPHPLSAEGIRQFSRLFLKVRMQLNPALQLLALTAVQLNPAFKLHRQIVADLVQQFGVQRVLGSIRTDIKLAEAFAARMPVLSYAPASRAAVDYRQLTRQLLQLHQPDHAVDTKSHYASLQLVM